MQCRRSNVNYFSAPFCAQLSPCSRCTRLPGEVVFHHPILVKVKEGVGAHFARETLVVGDPFLHPRPTAVLPPAAGRGRRVCCERLPQHSHGETQAT